MGIQDYLYNEFDSNIIEEFLMMLDIMEDNLDLTIERLYTDYDEAVNDLFRMFHNLKSAVAYLKIDRIKNFAHFVEDVLDKAREKKEAKEELIDWLFKVADQFHEWYGNIDRNEELAPLHPDIFKVPKL
ncbi:Hpt domain-containing protein [Nautilia lithotrophica]